MSQSQRSAASIRLAAVLSAMVFSAPLALAQATPPATSDPAPLDILQGRPDIASPASATGERYESKSTGLAFNPPAGMQRKPTAAGSDRLVRFVGEKKNWELLASQGVVSESMPLSSGDAVAADGPVKSGLLEQASQELKSIFPAADITEQKVIKVGPSKSLEVGLLSARMSADLKPIYSQQAIIKAGERRYFTISLTTPSADPKAENSNADALDKDAITAFKAAIDTLDVMDLRDVKADQDQRLFSTRALFVNLTPDRLKKALIPEQWFRIIQNGKDVGYSYVIEEVELAADKTSAKPQDGFRIGVRTRVFAPPAGSAPSDVLASPETLSIPGLTAAQVHLDPEPKAAPAATQPSAKVQVDAESWMWMSLDRRHGEWSNVALIDTGADRDHRSEVGSADRQVSQFIDKELQRGSKEDPQQPPVRRADIYTLNVRSVAKRNAPVPIERSLPPWYMPQALDHILPRLVPLGEAKGYMFAGYVSGERHEVMNRYVDVGREQVVDLAGKKTRAIPVRERSGLEGIVTTHWMSVADGHYLGSTCPDAGLAVVATDAATIDGIWKDKANLTRPAVPTDRAPKQPVASDPGQPAAPKGGAQDLARTPR